MALKGYRKTPLGERPVVLYCQRDQEVTKPRYGPVILGSYDIECNLEGYGSVIINGREFSFGPGACYVVMPGDVVTFTSDREQPRAGYWCFVRGLSLARYLQSAGITAENPFAPPETWEEIRYWMQQMVESWNKPDTASELRQTACVYGILGALHEGRSHTTSNSLIEKAIGLMESHYHQPLDVAQLAQRVGLARTYFSGLFKEKTGQTPHQYLTKLRVHNACLFLTNEPNRSISDIAELVGLEPQNFARLFKKETGKTPLEYRKQQKTK